MHACEDRDGERRPGYGSSGSLSGLGGGGAEGGDELGANAAEGRAETFVGDPETIGKAITIGRWKIGWESGSTPTTHSCFRLLFPGPSPRFTSSIFRSPSQDFRPSARVKYTLPPPSALRATGAASSTCMI